jgi:hypothetical protein
MKIINKTSEDKIVPFKGTTIIIPAGSELTIDLSSKDSLMMIAIYRFCKADVEIGNLVFEGVPFSQK